MNRHPYVGLTGIFHRFPFIGADKGKNDRHGIVVAVGQCIESSECAYTEVVYLADDGTTDNGSLVNFDPDDPTEARRRLTDAAAEWTGPDRYQHWTAEIGYYPEDYAPPAMEGYTEIGPWEAVGMISTSPSEKPIRDWRRPLRRVRE